MRSFHTVCGLAALSVSVRRSWATCNVYGIDFVNGGSYFINSASTEPFTAVQEFSGCQNDTSHNVLVDPAGDTIECSNTTMTPDYTPETLTCSTELENQMVSGDYSIIVISNNGNGDPIDYVREFSLSVGPQQTTTVTPTVTVVVSDTAVVTSAVTETDTETTILPPATITTTGVVAMDVASTAVTQVLTASTSSVTATALCATQTHHHPQIVLAYQHEEANCAPPKPDYIPDPVHTVTKTKYLTVRDSAKFRRALQERKTDISPELRAEFVAERRDRLAAHQALHKRAPDAPTVTVTATQTSDYITTTSTTWITTQTATMTTVTCTTVTITSSPVVVGSTASAAGDADVVAAAVNTVVHTPSAVWATQWIVDRPTEMRTGVSSLTITSRMSNSASSASCVATGGTYF